MTLSDSALFDFLGGEPVRLYGRRKIFTDTTEINAGNIEQVIAETMAVHRLNRAEINYLRWYVRGKQPILDRKKKVRKDVCSKVVMNIAQECLDFKIGYLWGEPVCIVRRDGEKTNNGIAVLNDYMTEQGKYDIDQDLANDFCICGLAHRMIFPNISPREESPFVMGKLDPETTYCVYRNDAFKRKSLAVSFCEHSDGTMTCTAYTDNLVFELHSDILGGGLKLREVKTNGIGIIPIVEYEAPDRAGIAFERALPLLDAANVLASNRLDDIQQFVASILWIHNADISDEDLQKIDELLAVKTASGSDGTQAVLKYLSEPLDQTSVQELQKSLEEHIYELSGVPGRVQSSGGSTGTAAELGEAGWKKVEYSAKRAEAAWKKGEREMLRVCLAIFDRTRGVPAEVKALRAIDIDIKLPRSMNYNIVTKTQGGLNMLQMGFHPRDVFKTISLVDDPEQAFRNALEGGYLERALQRMDGTLKQEQIDEQKKTGDVTNQPNGDEGTVQSVNKQTVVQKQD